MLTFTFIAHSAFELSDGSRSVLIDPFITGNPLATSKPEEYSPGTILLTHAHGDHVGDTVAIAKRTGAKVIATAELADYLQSKGVEHAHGANHGGTVAFDGGTTKLVPAWHTSSYFDAELGMTVAPGVPAGHVVRFDGKTIYFAGDTCRFGDMALIAEEGIDVAVIPIGDNYTMGPEDAVKSAKLLKASFVVPCHYNTFPGIRQDGAAFGTRIDSETDSKAIVLAPGESHDFA